MGEVDKKSVSLPPAFPREGPQTFFFKATALKQGSTF